MNTASTWNPFRAPARDGAPDEIDYNELDAVRLEALHEAGDPLATVRLAGMMLAQAEGDWPRAISWLSDLVDTSMNRTVLARAKVTLADAFVRGRGGLATAHQARDYFMDAAQEGIGAAFLGLGRWYEGSDPRFRTSAPNLELAASLYEEGVLAHSCGCATALARMHLHRRIGKSSRSLAERLLRRAAESGDAAARSDLARLERAGALVFTLSGLGAQLVRA